MRGSLASQLVNRDKSIFIVPNRSPPSRIQILENITGFKLEFFDDTGWDIDRLLLILPHYMAVQVESLPLCLDVLDRPMWKDTPDGRFSTKSAWQLVRTGGLVPVDVIIQKRICARMVSQCQCCSEIETIQHVFIDSHVAHQFVEGGHIHTIIPLLVLWFIWTSRNDVKHRRIGMEPSRIIWRVHHTIFYFIRANSFSLYIGVWTLTLPHILVLLLFFLPQPPTLVYWRALLAGSAKINTDGCVKDVFASGRGVIRNYTWHCIRAFSAGYRDIFILEAELRTILQGIEHVRRMGLVDLWIETDSTLAVHCISRGGGPWVIQSILTCIRHLLSFDRDTVFHNF
ncbi:Uncharacterized protein Adt_14515 [Abeliophyllum distichum]|uniref:RNase H type-1 domain-containing protein n=1 Tax=Abeliophyllum distichum TaxID=126358 RepID=A0ABD1U0L7_9LAMI